MAAPIIQLASDGGLAEQDRQCIRETALAGGLIVFPTDTVYGLGCNAFDADAIDRIYQLKNRPTHQPLSVHLSRTADLDGYAKIEGTQRSRIARLLPGPYTVVLTASTEAPPRCVSADGKIGLRVPDSPAFRAVAEAAERPLVGTSVNRSGEPSLNDVGAIHDQFASDVGLIVATEAPLSGAGSTVIDLTVEPPVALRGKMPPDL